MLTAVSLLLPCYLAMGMAMAIAVPDLLPDVSLLSRRERGALLATLFAAGLLMNYLIVLLLGSMRLSLIAGGLIAVAGVAHWVMKLRGRFLQLFGLGWLWLPVLYLLSLYGIPLILDPLSAGDARSIWFFHGKMIYYTGVLGPETGLAAKAVEFSHVDYPKFAGVLAAQFATVAGHWNEFVPKGGLVALFLPLVFAAVAFAGRIRVSSLFLLCLLFFGSGWYLWNGYMDGYLAVYAGISLLFWGRWLTDGSGRDFCGGVAFLGVAMNLKNEGVLFAVTLGAALGLMLLLRRNRPFRLTMRHGAVVILPLLCTLVWSMKKSLWGLENDLRLGLGSIPIMQRHLEEGAARLISQSLIGGGMVGTAVIIAGAAVVAALCFRVRIPVSVWLSLTTGSLYFTGMFSVYLATTADLQWHLSTSAVRTMMTVLACFFAATYLVLRELEDSFRDSGFEKAENDPESGS